MRNSICILTAFIFTFTYHWQVYAETPVVHKSPLSFADTRIVDISPLPGEQITIADLEKKYPNAEVRPVPLGHLEDIKEQHPEQVINECGVSTVGVKASSGDDRDFTPRANINPYGRGSTGGNSKDFLIIVAVIGVVVVAALVVYSVSYLIQSGTSLFKCSVWRDFGVRFSYFLEDSQVQIREGRLAGLYFTSGYRVPFGIMGLTAETGTFNLDMQIKKKLKLKRIGDPYLLVGPSFSIPFHDLEGHMVQIELLVGTSSNKDIGLLSTLRFGLLLRLAPSLSWGLNTGAALINVKGYDNYLEDRDQLNSIWGTSISYLW